MDIDDTFPQHCAKLSDPLISWVYERRMLPVDRRMPSI